MDAKTSAYIDSIVDRKIVLAFDLYGTLLSTESISKKLAEYYGDKADALAAAWRRYQLEYTWRLNSMGTYEPFDIVTKKALLHTLTEASIPLEPSQITAIIASYSTLSPFPDVPSSLTSLLSPDASTKRLINPIIFTNGNPEMVQSSISSTPELSVFTKLRDPIVSVHDMEKYKPHPMVYEYLAAKLGKKLGFGAKHGGVDEVLLVTANPFDVVGAQAVGITGVWVDRAGKGWSDHLAGEGPKFTIKELGELKGVVDEILETKQKVWDEIDKESGRGKSSGQRSIDDDDEEDD